jgi:hypothetical protein
MSNDDAAHLRVGSTFTVNDTTYKIKRYTDTALSKPGGYLDDIALAYPPPADGQVLSKNSRGKLNETIIGNMLENKLLKPLPADAASEDIILGFARKHTFPTHKYTTIYWNTNSIKHSKSSFATVFEIILAKKFNIRVSSNYNIHDEGVSFTLDAETGEEGPNAIDVEYWEALDKSSVVEKWEISRYGEHITIKESMFVVPTLGDNYELFVVHPDELGALVVSDACVLLFTFLGYGVAAAHHADDVTIRQNEAFVRQLHATVDKYRTPFWDQFISFIHIVWVNKTPGVRWQNPKETNAATFIHLPMGKQLRDVELVRYPLVLEVDRTTMNITIDLLKGHIAVIHRTETVGHTFYDPGDDKNRYFQLLNFFPDLKYFSHPIHNGIQRTLEDGAPNEESGLCQALVYLRILAFVRGDLTGKTEDKLSRKLSASSGRKLLIKLVTGMVASASTKPIWKGFLTRI